VDPVSPAGLAVGVDIGTTETKALVIDTADGRRVGFARRRTHWVTSAEGVQTSAEVLFDGVLEAVSAALDDAALDDATPDGGSLDGRSLDGGRATTGYRAPVVGIGLAGLAESGVVLDPAGRVTTPVIAWFDQRGTAELAGLDAEFRASWPGRVGLPLDAQCTLAKLLWLRGQGVDLGPGSRWLNVPEYIAHTLGGERATEPSLAARTGLVDQTTGRGWSPALDRLGVGPAFLPPVRAAGHELGRVTHPDAPPRLRGARITVAGHDHPVAAVGSGATAPDTLFNSAGTADVLLRSVPRSLSVEQRAELVAGGHSAGAHVLPGHTALIGSVRAGLVLGRVLELLGRTDAAGRSQLDRRWRADAPPTGVVVEGAEQSATEVTVRITDGAGPDALWAAALAHVSAVTAALLGTAQRIVGEHRDALAGGGWVRWESVRASKARTIPRLRFTELDQPGAYGAALFAARAGAGRPLPFDDVGAPPRPTGRARIGQPQSVRTEEASSR
jgi:sugar (pentulose or hexulose) kinase